MFSHHHICMRNGISIESIFKSHCKIQKHCFSSCNASENFSTGTAAQERARRIPCSLSSADKKEKPFSSALYRTSRRFPAPKISRRLTNPVSPAVTFASSTKILFASLHKIFVFSQIVFPGFANLTFQMTIPDKLTQCDLFRFGCRLIIKISASLIFFQKIRRKHHKT